jgi:hypothetical protein
MSLEEIANTVIRKYPQASKFKNREYKLHIPLTEEVYISINYKKYPNPPKVKLVKNNGRTFNLTNILSHLRDWDISHPFAIVDVINEIFLVIESILNRVIPFTETCFQGLIEMAKDHHPRKVQGLLSVKKGKVSELIIPVIKCAEPGNRINYVNFTSFCRLPFDFSYEGTFISRPDGDLTRNEMFNVVMRKRRFTMLLAYPYDNPENVRLVDRDGKELKYVVYSD